MASRTSRHDSKARMQQELQCVICRDEYKEPKVAGPCQHSFCRECLHQYLTSSSSGPGFGKNMLFNCPMCRQECPLPPTGVDGLETNRLIVSMIEILSETTEEEEDLIPGMTEGAKASARQNSCYSCQEAGMETSTNASLICAACEGSRLCDDCGQGHPEKPDSLHHEVTSICGPHGKSLGRFCRTCSKPICIDCSRTQHPKPDHDVQTYRTVIDESKQGLLVQIEAAKKENDVLALKGPNLFQVKEKEDADMEKFKSEIMNSIDEVWSRRPQQCQSRLIRVRDKILRNLDENLERLGDDIGVLYTDMTDQQEELSQDIERGERLYKEKILRSGLHEAMLKVTKQLELVSTNARILYSKERTDPIINKEVATIKRKEFSMSWDFLESAGMYSRALFSESLELPKNHVVLGVTGMSGRRIAVCSGTRKSGGDLHRPPYELNIWQAEGNPNPVTLISGDDPLVDVTDGKEDKLVVLCQRGPVLRVVHPVTKESNAVDVNIPEEDKKWLVQVQVDFRGQFLVTFNNHARDVYVIMVVLPDGVISHEINVGCPAESFALCKLTGMLVTCSVFGDTIRSCPWQGSSTDTVSASHGMKGFNCSDLCSGNLGEIFVVGLMMKRGHHSDEIRAYQLDLDDDGDSAILLHRVKIKADQLEMTERSWPKCSLTIEGDCLIICYGEMIKLFKLKP